VHAGRDQDLFVPRRQHLEQGLRRAGRQHFPCQCQLLQDVGADALSDVTAPETLVDTPSDLGTDPSADPGPDACQPACVDRQCGSDGCGGSCGACPTGSSCDAAGHCHSADCGASAVTVTGQVVTTQGALSFDSVVVAVRHKQDVDPYEDGCLAEIVVDLRRGAGCHLSLRAAEVVDGAGALEIRAATLSADSQCPGFPDGCGGSCGTCTAWPGSYCKADGSCGCQKQCAGKECGADGCGEECASGQCEYTACFDRECGSDGCGGSCGDCWWYGAGYECDANGLCACTPTCAS
jgi:hypothetical protein